MNLRFITSFSSSVVWIVLSRSKIFEDELLILSAQHGAYAHVPQNGLDFARRQRIGGIVAPTTILFEFLLSRIERSIAVPGGFGGFLRQIRRLCRSVNLERISQQQN